MIALLAFCCRSNGLRKNLAEKQDRIDRTVGIYQEVKILETPDELRTVSENSQDPYSGMPGKRAAISKAEYITYDKARL